MSLPEPEEEHAKAPVKGGRKHSKRHKKVLIHVSLNTVRRIVPIEGTDYVMEYTLTEDSKMAIRKGHFKDPSSGPRIDVRTTKAADLRDEFNTYCGEKKSIKNWLFYT